MDDKPSVPETILYFAIGIAIIAVGMVWAHSSGYDQGQDSNVQVVESLELDNTIDLRSNGVSRVRVETITLQDGTKLACVAMDSDRMYGLSCDWP